MNDLDTDRDSCSFSFNLTEQPFAFNTPTRRPATYVHLTPFLHYSGLKNIIMFSSSSVSLKPTSVWDPLSNVPLSENHIDFDIPSFFGVVPADISSTEALSYDLSRWACLSCSLVIIVVSLVRSCSGIVFSP